MTMRTVWYRCLTHCEESFYELKPMHSDFDRWMAREAAEDYHSEHDGWEANWPLEFALHETENGPEIARFEVQREVEPVFYATEIKRVEGKPCA
jgi:hypothetical protein